MVELIVRKNDKGKDVGGYEEGEETGRIRLEKGKARRTREVGATEVSARK